MMLEKNLTDWLLILRVENGRQIHISQMKSKLPPYSYSSAIE